MTPSLQDVVQAFRTQQATLTRADNDKQAARKRDLETAQQRVLMAACALRFELCPAVVQLHGARMSEPLHNCEGSSQASFEIDVPYYYSSNRRLWRAGESYSGAWSNITIGVSLLNDGKFHYTVGACHFRDIGDYKLCDGTEARVKIAAVLGKLLGLQDANAR